MLALLKGNWKANRGEKGKGRATLLTPVLLLWVCHLRRAHGIKDAFGRKGQWCVMTDDDDDDDDDDVSVLEGTQLEHNFY